VCPRSQDLRSETGDASSDTIPHRVEGMGARSGELVRGGGRGRGNEGAGTKMRDEPRGKGMCGILAQGVEKR